jgi:hypothetical protein
MGLPEGIYEVNITPSMTSQPEIINNIAITKGKTSDLGTTSL